MKTPQAASAIYSLILLAAIVLASNPVSAGQPQFTAAQLATLQPAVPTAPPEPGNYWLLVGPNPGMPSPPYPFPPPVSKLTNVVTYRLDDWHYLVDDSQVDYAEFRAQQALDAALTDLEVHGLARPMGLDDDGGGIRPMDVTPYPSNSLWLSISQLTNGVAPLVVHGTIQDLNYEILSKQTLTDAVWFSEGTVPGAVDQDWTPTAVSVGDRTNSLFLWCRSWVSSNGSGIPDWWLWQYFTNIDIDPYALCPSGDGWTIYQAYENNWNPYLPYTPPPPRNVAASLDATGTRVLITWQSGGGPVTNYVIQRAGFDWFGPWFQPVGETNASTFALEDSLGYSILEEPTGPWNYVVSAYFTDGSHANSLLAPLWKPGLTPTLALVRGPAAELYLTISSAPPQLSRIRLFWFSILAWDTLWLDVDATNVVNGAMRIPVEQMTGYVSGAEIDVQAIATDVDFGAVSSLFPTVAPEEVLGASEQTPYRFVDARSHLKENLKFLLQSATVSQAFTYIVGDPYLPDPTLVWFPETEFARPPSPTSYEYSGFHVFSSNLNYSVMQEFRPAQENYLWRNFAYEPEDFDSSGNWTNGALFNPSLTSLRWLDNPNYQFTGTNDDPLALGLSLTNHAYLFGCWGSSHLTLDIFPNNFGEVGVLLNEANHVYVPTGVRNIYGLALNSVMLPEFEFPTGLTLTAGGAAGPLWDIFVDRDVFCAFQPPSLQTVDYYFASQTPYLSAGYSGWSGSGPLSGPAPPLPGSPTFSPTNTSPLLITGFGQPITVSGWAKQTITHPDNGKYAYLEQYFDKAYTIGSDGVATTNEAGLLSPYGEFFPMQPGPAALVTMPDIDPPYQRGTGVVNVIKLQTDVDHNGQMDLSFGGQDNASQARPQVVWVNNDNDGTGIGKDSVVYPNKTMVDWQYGSIRSQRNLEDFFRLWVCGLPKLPPSQGYAVTLTMSPSSGSPAINLYAAITNSADYLTDTNVAAAQFTQIYFNGQLMFDYSKKVGTISTSQSYSLPLSSDGTPQYTNFLFEGAGIGAGQLTMTISQATSQGSNVIAQTSTWLDLHDAKDFYERAVITNIYSGAISNWTSAVEIVQPASASALGDDTNLIVLVHGINVSYEDWLIQGDTVLKRLYWAGYRGKFCAVKWPCLRSLQTIDFNTSELYGYKAGDALKTYLDQLRSRFPGHRLNLLAHSQGNSIVGEAIRKGASFDTYILTQGAMPASAYDVNAPTYTAMTNADFVVHTPEWQSMGYRGIYTNANFTGNIVNFYNYYDPVLNFWIADQLELKPNNYLFNGGDYFYDGTNSWRILEGAPPRLVTDPQESRSMVSRSRTLPIGQSGPTTQHGVVKSGIDLNAAYGFYKAFPDDHSAQWVWPIQTTRPYFQQVLTSCGLHPAP